ncbi:PKD domain-containing protein [Amnibacterium sp.]|uniref:PKD domain-containing protein n=1 Tax=Amnibacterium sp. TaxID=1872496 RepID=UPI003F7BC0AB
MALPTSTALADTAPAPGAPTTVSSDSLPAPQINGVVWAQTVVGNIVYAGGNFTQAQPAGAAAGVDTVSRAAMLAYNLTTGALIATFTPSFNAQVRGLAASSDGSTIYAVGDFTTVNGASHPHIVALDATTGAVRPGFTTSANGNVIAVATSGTTVYFGGDFTSVNGVTRTRAAAVSGTSGVLTGFAPRMPSNAVHALVVSPDGSKVVLGGSFPSLNGSSSPGEGLGAVDSATGQVNQTWNVGKLIYDHGNNSSIWSLWSDGTNVYGTGYVYGSLSDGNLEGAFNATWADGTVDWIEDCHGDSYSVATQGSAVYVVSHAHFCGDIPGGFNQTDPNPSKALKQHAMAFSKATAGTLAHDPYGAPYADFAGTPAPKVLTWYPDLAIGSFTGQYQAAWNITTSGGYVLLGGEFPSVNGSRQNGLARFAVSSIAPNRDGPQLSATNWSSGTNWKPNAVSLGAGTVRVTWPANWDRDNANLTYTVKRGSATVYTTTAESEGFWLRPTLGFTDTGLSPGSTATYTVTATDPFGNSATSAAVTATVAAGSGASAYANAVIADGASDYWRFGEASGPTAYDWAGYSDLTAGTGVTFGAPGAIQGDTDTAATFSGDSSGLAATQTAIPGPNTFSIESWFKTTSTAGGKVVGFGNANAGASSNYDRHIYMGADGTVYFGVYNGTTSTLKSSSGYNDGKWHDAVASLSSAGMRLYLDGKLIGSRSDVTQGQDYSGYWRIGGDTSWSGASYFAGQIDDTAIYPTALSAATVSAHYGDATSGAASTVPVASFTTNPSDLAVALDATGSSDTGGKLVSYAWDFGDGSAVETATTATTTHTYAKAGTYSIVLRVTDDHGATSSVTKQVTVSAANQAPAASFTSSVNGLGASFDASASKDSDGSIASYAWDFGDGSAIETDTTASTAHTYSKGGSYTVSLTVTDNQGATDTVKHAVTVAAPNQPPTASFTSATSGLTVNVDGSGSSDPDGTVASYAWDFGDGHTATGATAAHTYAAGGTFTVQFTVTDNGGATASVTRSVTVTAPSSSTLGSDSFDRTVNGGLGTADVGGPWTLAGTASDFSVASGAAQFSTAPGSTRSAYLGSVSSTSSDVATTISLPNLPVGGRSFAGVVGRRVGSNDYNARILVGAAGDVTVQVVQNGSYLDSATVAGLTYTPGLPLKLRMQTSGTNPTTVQARVWKASGTEPASWQVSATDSTAALQSPGSVGLRTYLSSTTTNGATAFSFSGFAVQSIGTAAAANVPPTASFTDSTNGLSVSVDGSKSSDSDGTIKSYAWDFGDSTTGTGPTASHTYAAPGTFTVTLTVADDQGAKTATTKQVTVSSSGISPHIATDAFARSVTGGLGSADTGGSWTTTNTASSYAVGGGAATFTDKAGQTLAAYLNAVNQTSSDVSIGFGLPALPQGGSVYAGVVGRRVGSDDYNGRIIVSPAGGVTIQVLRGGTWLQSATVTGLAAKAGSTIDLRLQTFGTGTTTLRARAWLDGTPEPSTWQVSSTDGTSALQTGGSVGLRTYSGGGLSNSPFAITVDNFVADPAN